MKRRQVFRWLFCIATVAVIGIGVYWYVRANQPIRLIMRTCADRERVGAMCFSPDGKYFFTGGMDGLKKWETKTARLICEYKPPLATSVVVNQVISIACHPNEQLLYLSGGGPDVLIWNYELEKLVGKIKTESIWIPSIAIDSKGKYLAISESRRENNNGPQFTVLLWDLEKNQEYLRFSATLSVVVSLAFRPDSPQLAICAKSGAVKIWDIVTNECLANLGSSDSVITDITGDDADCFCFIPEKDEMFLGTTRWRTDTWTLGKNPILLSERRYGQAFDSREVGTIRNVFRNGDFAVCALRVGKVGILDLRNDTIFAEATHFTNGTGVGRVDISPDGKTMISAGYGRLDWSTGKVFNVQQHDRNLCVWRVNVR